MYYPYEANDAIYYMDEFQWRLDIPYYELTDKQKEMLRAADMLQEYRLSIRGTSRETGISRSHLHSFIHGELKSICYELYQLCIRQLKWNSENSQSFMK